jgi:hypothetical protein
VNSRAASVVILVTGTPRFSGFSPLGGSYSAAFGREALRTRAGLYALGHAAQNLLIEDKFRTMTLLDADDVLIGAVFNTQGYRFAIYLEEDGFEPMPKIPTFPDEAASPQNPPTWLLLVDDPRPADLLRDEADSNLDTVGDFDEGNAAIHPVVLAVESQRPLNVADARPLAGKR